MTLLRRAWAALRRPVGPEPPAAPPTEGSQKLARSLAAIEPTSRELRAKIDEPLPPYPSRNALGNAFAHRGEPSP